MAHSGAVTLVMDAKGSGADTSVEEQVQLRRTNTTAVITKHQSSRRRYTLSEHDTKRDRYMREKLKYLATLQDEVNLGRELVCFKYQINTKALMTIYEQLGYPTSGQEKSRLEEVIWQVNDNLDGALCFEEFVNSYVRSRNDRSGLEPSEVFFLTCFLMFDKECCGRVSLLPHPLSTYEPYSDNLGLLVLVSDLVG
ncbi:unnamed protein product [Phytophthora fragariaefolia]|uniref:Unnamed protein product n=1 Tax=Phytophthora fragariaefolia TaxID=1490495 RepID=A0A9W6WPJ4_9STRA|nr:unnamed protein product [Phytophthora fragariaefolia]